MNIIRNIELVTSLFVRKPHLDYTNTIDN